MKRKMNFLRLALILGLLSVLTLGTVNAETCERKIIVFNEDVTQEQIDDYINSWQEFGLIPVESISLINGYVVCVPELITNDQLSGDPRVLAVENDEEIGSQSSANVTYVAPDEVIEEVQEVDEGIEDELQASGFRRIKRFIRVFSSYQLKSTFRRPWGMLSLLGHHYDRSDYSSVFVGTKLYPDTIELAKQKLAHKKIKVAVFDTGIDYTNPIFSESIKGGKDLVNFIDEIPMDINGHGSHVSASIVGEETGLAEGCELYAVKVLDDDATGRVSTLIKAFQWAIKKKIDVINMSIAFRQNNFAVRLAVKKAYRSGIILVAAVGNHSNWLDDNEAAGASVDWGYAAGNSGVVIDVDADNSDDSAESDETNQMTEEEIQAVADGGASEGGASAYGSSAIPFPVMYPAAYPEVIAVGAHDSSGKLARFTNFGKEMDITAPGVGIISANIKSISKYGVCNGTSMAAPHVAAAVALMKALDQNNKLSPAKAKSILKKTATNGKLNLKDALAEVLKL